MADNFDFSSFPEADTSAAPVTAAADQTLAPTSAPADQTPVSSAPKSSGFDWDSHPAVGSAASSSGFDWSAHPAVSAPFGWDEHPVASSAVPSLLTRLKNVVAGPGTFGGTHVQGDSWSNLVEHPVDFAHEFYHHASDLENAPFVKPDNAMTPERQKAHPVITGASQFASELTTPQNVGIAAIAGGVLKTAPIAEALTGSLSKVAVKAIPSLVSAGFGVSMIKNAYDQIPEIKDALDRGDSSEAKRLITHAVLSGTIGAAVAFHGASGLHDVGSEALSEPGKVSAATRQTDYANAIHQYQGENQITAASADQFKNAAESAVPDEKRREALTNFREAGGDKELLALREQATREQAATGKGPAVYTATPLVIPERGQGPDIPFGGPPSAAQIANEQLAENAAKKPITPAEQKQFAERAKTLAEGYKIAQQLTPEEIAVERKGAQLLADRKAELQKVGLLPQGQVQENYVHHDWQDIPSEEDPTVQVNSPRDFSPASGNKDFLNRRTVPTYHVGEAEGFNPTNKDLAALDSDYLRDSGNVLSQKHLVNNLEQGTTNSGAPLVVKGGFMAQNGTIVTNFPQDVRLGDATVKSMTAKGQLSDLVKSGEVYMRPDQNGMPAYYFKTSDYVETPLKTTQLMRRPMSLAMQSQLGVTDQPEKLFSDAARRINEKRILDLQRQGTLFPTRDAEGNLTGLYETTAIPVRVPLYAHPEIAEHLNNAINEYRPGPAVKSLLRASSEAKQGLLSWSPFHAVTEVGRNMASRGPITGLVGSAKNIAGYVRNFDTIDYNNLTPIQDEAIRNGLVASEIRPRSTSYTEEGLSAGDSKALVNRAVNKVTAPIEDGIKKFVKKSPAIDEGLKKLGLPIDSLNLNLNQVFANVVFGPQGLIVRQKFGLYEDIKPKIAEAVAKKNPKWSPEQVNTVAGRAAAAQANNAYGGLNYTILGRSMKNQAALRGLFLAPDFMESSGRNLVDMVGPYGGPLLKRFLAFNAAMYLAARSLNYALNHKKGDDMDESLAATHPEAGLGVVSPDGKKIYTFRTQLGDLAHMLGAPMDYALNRVNPLGKTAYSVITGKNQYGRQLPPEQRYIETPLKTAAPILSQSLLPNRAINEPTKTDRALAAFGVGNRPAQSPAEDLAIQKAENTLAGKPLKTGPGLVRQQLSIRAEDQLRDAYAKNNKAAIKAATDTINNYTNRKMISTTDRDRIMKDARLSRLESIFGTLSPGDALNVWEKATTTEKRVLSGALQKKFGKWQENLQKQGSSLRTLDPDDQQTYDRFRKASQDVNSIKKQ